MIGQSYLTNVKLPTVLMNRIDLTNLALRIGLMSATKLLSHRDA